MPRLADPLRPSRAREVNSELKERDHHAVHHRRHSPDRLAARRRRNVHDRRVRPCVLGHRRRVIRRRPAGRPSIAGIVESTRQGHRYAALMASEQFADIPFDVRNHILMQGVMDLRQLTNPTVMTLAVAVILAVAVLAWLDVQRRHKPRQRSCATVLGRSTSGQWESMGPNAERKRNWRLARQRVEKLKIRDLDPAELERFSGQWQALQSRFVDDPKAAVTEADALVSSRHAGSWLSCRRFPSTCRGYVRRPSPSGGATTGLRTRLPCDSGKGKPIRKTLRTAMIHYRSLFEELVHVPIRCGNKGSGMMAEPQIKCMT